VIFVILIRLQKAVASAVLSADMAIICRLMALLLILHLSLLKNGFHFITIPGGKGGFVQEIVTVAVKQPPIIYRCPRCDPENPSFAHAARPFRPPVLSPRSPHSIPQRP
jgi:hypothetical protein